ncbi:alpha/beta fold hydrolase [Alloalcanivorax mobilis]|uniref:alpha/beta fold hydrolase n=1 Tax=Alloalcanivorax mobilis TaxID=2019569 RepID=UPI000B5B18B1|nr:alpha/beta hydrolase [Alloalcanivorax mobilis]ASK33550.1 alpha/beta hydrolase [Alcanivorax sp. N3-2A]|tara:strand:- start:10865 stop:11833 length:969 start_codon:yes stop_codon:yes gene_type:complete
MTTITEQRVQANGLTFHVREAGEAGQPVIILLHGFPECGYSWRYQMPFLAARGYHVLAPDLRGYGFSDAPKDVAAYRQDILVADVMGILDAYGAEKAIVVGHDWGCALAWQVARSEPERVRAVAGLSVPYPGIGPKAPTEQMRAAFGERFFYQIYFQQPEIPEQELEADVRDFLRRMYHAISGPGMQEKFRTAKPAQAFLDILQPPSGAQPAWMQESDLDVYVKHFHNSGLTGPINWYRAMDISWRQQREDGRERIHPPAVFIAGKEDPVIQFAGKALKRMPEVMDDLTDVVLLDNIGHWVQMEAPDAVNRHLGEFLDRLDR